MIKVAEVSRTFGNRKAVDNISFDVKEGETLVLAGTSGCGKTTTLRMINRLLEPTMGIIEVDGQNIMLRSPEELRRSIGYVLQHNGLFPHYTVAENIALVPELLKWDKELIAAQTDIILKKLRLSRSLLSVFPGSLSGGQQQRVGLARALIADPAILLMDEPFGALDPITRLSIKKEFSALEEFKRKTIILVTHDIQEAFELGDRICLMDKGRIMQIGTGITLLFHPANDFVKNFLDQQRFQLELRAVTPKELAPFLEDELFNLYKDYKSLWEILERSSLHEDRQSPGRGLEHSQIPSDLAAILTAFREFKNTMINERTGAESF